MKFQNYGKGIEDWGMRFEANSRGREVETSE